jgi:hypothetical protein
MKSLTMDLKQIFFYLVLVTFAPACKHGHAEESQMIKDARVIQNDALKMYDEVVASVEIVADSTMKAGLKLQLEEWKKGMLELPHNHDHDHDHDHDHHHHDSDLTDQQLLDGQKSWKEALETIKNSIPLNTNQ